MNFIQKLFRRTPTIRFKCTVGGYYVSTPIVAARTILPYWLKKQVDAKDVKFVRCPGMSDLSREGYLMCAWTDIHIKANRQGTAVHMPLLTTPELNPQLMDFAVVDGLAPIDDTVAKKVTKLPTPWGVFTEPGYSAHVLPAVMHSPFLDKLYVYAGTNDYEDFHTCNFIFSAITACEIIIPAGTPLLHILPFKRENFHAVTGLANRLETDQHRFGFTTRAVGAYRRLFHKKKIYTIEVEK